MRVKNTFVFSLFIMILAGLIVAGDASTEAGNSPFPAYGSGAVEVRIYSDYFCSSCGKLEPAVEPILKDLLKEKVIRLTLVDAPLHPFTALFARYFLYALKENPDMDHAFQVRNILFNASADKSIRTKERIEALFKEKGVPYAAFDTKPAFDRYNALIKEDSVKQTPTCVIIKSGQKETLVGRADTMNALKALQ